MLGEGNIVNGVDAGENGEEEPNKAGAQKSVGSGMSAGKITKGFSCWEFIFESEDEGCDDTESGSEKEDPESVTIV